MIRRAMIRNMSIEDLADRANPPPWLHLLSPVLRAWRETQVREGTDPDLYIEQRLRGAGVWPVGPVMQSDDASPA